MTPLAVRASEANRTDLAYVVMYSAWPDRGARELDRSDVATDAVVIPIEPYLNLTRTAALTDRVAAVEAGVTDFVHVEPGHSVASGGPNTDTEVAQFVDEHHLAGAVRTLRTLVQVIFGDEAGVHLGVKNDRETGRPELLVQATYPVAEGEFDVDALLDLEDELLSQYVAQVPPRSRTWVSFVGMLADAD